MRRSNQRHRSNHVILGLPIIELNGAVVPVIFDDNGSACPGPLLYFVWKRQQEYWSAAEFWKQARCLGRWLDYIGQDDFANATLNQALKAYFGARKEGYPKFGWRPVSSAADDVEAISEFGDFCAQVFDVPPINPIVQPQFSNVSRARLATWAKRLSQRGDWDMLVHALNGDEAVKSLFGGRAYQPERPKRQKSRGKSFPAAYVRGMFDACKNPRDELAFLLLFYGGLRESELMHIFVSDISLLPDGTARVVLAEPELAPMEWRDAAGRLTRGTRTDFLKEQFGISPRTCLPKNSNQFAGWKGMLFQENNQTEVIWAVPEAGRRFWELHQKYMREVRLGVTAAHPYYFVEIGGPGFGTPWSLSAFDAQFTRCVEAVGLRRSRYEGVNPHGARHFMGYFLATVLKVDLLTAQEALRHVRVSSTRVYFHRAAEVARNEIARAYAAAELPSFLLNEQEAHALQPA